MSGIHIHNHRHPNILRGAGDGLVGVAFWQFLTFVMLVLLIWLNEIIDLSALWFGAKPTPPSVFRGCVMTIGTIVVAIVTIGHTYLQQKQIISGLLTVCASCRRIRVEQDVWEQLDEYITEHSVALISHGLCPKCFDVMQKEITAMGEDQDNKGRTPVQSSAPAG
jgi:hypothetical protein